MSKNRKEVTTITPAVVAFYRSEFSPTLSAERVERDLQGAEKMLLSYAPWKVTLHSGEIAALAMLLRSTHDGTDGPAVREALNHEKEDPRAVLGRRFLSPHSPCFFGFAAAAPAAITVTSSVSGVEFVRGALVGGESVQIWPGLGRAALHVVIGMVVALRAKEKQLVLLPMVDLEAAAAEEAKS